nr:prepilin-type N-terminal cleavage/methylation domain-containing protein [Candidatus Gracilibacteria bacterium]
MQQSSKKAFTLVELIVVITILVILGSIAFISLQSYTKNARDGQRLSDINNIRKNLELFLTEKGFYPTPDNGVNITYSGATAWIQGTVGDNVIKNLQKLNKKPTDPLTQNEYTYSITNLKTEYQIGAILEGGSILGYNVLPQTYAATPLKKATAMVVGTYNEKILKTSTGGLDYILAVPSIINGDIQDVDLMSIINKKQLVYNNYTNLPDSYNNQGYSMTGGFDFIPNKLVVYSGSTQDLLQDSNKLILINNLKQAYINTIVQGEPTYKEIINTDTTTNQVGAITLVNNYLSNGLGGLPKVNNQSTSSLTCNQGENLSTGVCKDPYWNNVVLLMHMDGTNSGTVFTDVKGKTINRYGNVVTNTSNKKFGTASSYFGGASNYLTLLDSEDWNFIGDFTIEAWIYPTNYGKSHGSYASSVIFSQVPSSSNRSFECFILGSNTSSFKTVGINVFDAGGSIYSSSSSGALFFTNSWYHVAFVRSGNVLKTFLNGKDYVNYTFNGTIRNSTASVFIGKNERAAYDDPFIGYIDELRVTKGVARYTTNFTPPNQSFANQ